MANPSSRTTYGLVFLVILVIVGFLAYSALNAPDRRSTGQRVGDAIDQLPNGVDKAGRELQDRTPGDRIGDAVKDAGDKVKEETR